MKMVKMFQGTIQILVDTLALMADLEEMVIEEEMGEMEEMEIFAIMFLELNIPQDMTYS